MLITWRELLHMKGRKEEFASREFGHWVSTDGRYKEKAEAPVGT